MEREPMALHHSANDYDDRNDFLHLLLGLVSVSRTVTDLLGGNQDPDEQAAPDAAQTAAAPPARDLLC